MGQLSKAVDVEQSQGRNDCGPCVTAMVLNFFGVEKVTPGQIAHEMRFWRIPWIRATLPWGIVRTLKNHNLEIASGWFGRLEDVKAQIDADHPVIVLVRPTDLDRVPSFSLHYRVIVGYNDSADAPGGGELFFNCSARPASSLVDSKHAGNLVLSYAQFRHQWLTWVSLNWYAAVSPRKAGLG